MDEYFEKRKSVDFILKPKIIGGNQTHRIEENLDLFMGDIVKQKVDSKYKNDTVEE